MYFVVMPLKVIAHNKTQRIVIMKTTTVLKNTVIVIALAAVAVAIAKTTAKKTTAKMKAKMKIAIESRLETTNKNKLRCRVIHIMRPYI